MVGSLDKAPRGCPFRPRWPNPKGMSSAGPNGELSWGPACCARSAAGWTCFRPCSHLAARGRASILSRTFFPARCSIQHRPGAQAVLPEAGASSSACVPQHLLFPNPGVGQSGNKPSVSTSGKWTQCQQKHPCEAVGVGQRCKGGTRPHRPLPHLPALPPSLPCSMLVAPPFSQCVTEKPTDHSSGLSDPL